MCESLFDGVLSGNEGAPLPILARSTIEYGTIAAVMDRLQLAADPLFDWLRDLPPVGWMMIAAGAFVWAIRAR